MVLLFVPEKVGSASNHTKNMMQNLDTLAAAAMARAFSRRDPWDEFRLETSSLFIQLLKGEWNGLRSHEIKKSRGTGQTVAIICFHCVLLYLLIFAPRFPAAIGCCVVWRV